MDAKDPSPEVSEGSIKPEATLAILSAALGVIQIIAQLSVAWLVVAACVVATAVARALYKTKSIDALRTAALGFSFVAVGAVSYAVWPAGAQAAQAPQPTTSTTPSAQTSALAASLDIGITPSNDSSIGTCTMVSGQGEIPAGYAIWVANLNDGPDGADTSAFFNIREATEEPGDGVWRTQNFGVGALGSVNVQYWIYVFLVPDVESSVLARTMVGTSLSGVMDDWPVIKRIPVVRNAQNTC